MTRPRTGAGARLAAVASTDDPATELVAVAAPVFPAVTQDSIRLPGDLRPGGVSPDLLYSWLLQAAETRPTPRTRLGSWEQKYPEQAAAWAPVPVEPWSSGAALGL